MCDIHWLDYCVSQDVREQNIRSRKLDRLLKDSKKQERNQIKLLLLGTGESGKSTFIKQMRIIYDKGYSTNEKMSYVKSILHNIVSSMASMVDAMITLNIRYEHNENQHNAVLFKNIECTEISSLTDIQLAAIKSLWNDAGIQECYKRRREYQLADSIKYYLTHIDRIGTPNYLPTQDDILHVRIQTTGLVEYQFKIDGMVFRMIDIGGQRSQRRKWMHCFDNAKVILFLVAISEYDQVLREEEQQNRLIESKNVFQTIVHYEWFCDTSIVVFFNKIDLLKEKIMYSDLEKYFPAFKGPKNNDEAARKFIQKMFLEVTHRRDIYKHFTCATDTQNIQIVFAVVRDTILNHHLDGSLV